MAADPKFLRSQTLQGTQLLWKGTHLLCKGLTFYEKGPTFYASSAGHRCSPGDSTFMKRDPPFMQVLPDIAALVSTLKGDSPFMKRDPPFMITYSNPTGYAWYRLCTCSLIISWNIKLLRLWTFFSYWTRYYYIYLQVIIQFKLRALELKCTNLNN